MEDETPLISPMSEWLRGKRGRSCTLFAGIDSIEASCRNEQGRGASGHGKTVEQAMANALNALMAKGTE